MSTSRNALEFRQLFDRESCTYTYILADSVTKDAIIIDPVDTLVDRDVGLIEDLGLNLIYAANTHVHADHITGTGLLKKKLPQCKSVLGAHAKPAEADVFLGENEELKFGTRSISARATPGHTEGCTSFLLDDESMVFSGDTMFVRGCGRTDFQGGSSESLYNSVHSKLFTLPDATKVYPAHDYKGRTVTTIGEEKKFNPRLTKSKEEFVKIMFELNLPRPGRMDEVLPKNLHCGF
eukprot:m.339940 g.339940  ORF g.339940 m.339940 type:complete len:236 (+) comp20588_c0_seq11:273-980(+)